MATTSSQQALLAVAALSALMFAAMHAAAAESDEPARLTYRAPAECPSAAEFAALIVARTTRFARPLGPLHVDVEIRTRPGPRGTIGRLLLEYGESRSLREIEGDQCSDVVSALAVIVAILVDSDAAAQPEPKPSARSLPRTPARALPDENEQERWFVVTGLDLSVVGAAAPRLTLGPRWFVGIERETTLSLPWSVRLSGFLGQSGSTQHSTGEVSAFYLRALRVDGCALKLTHRDLALEPCLFFEGGWLTAWAHHPADPATNAGVAWTALGGIARGSLIGWDVLVLELELGAEAPLRRYRFHSEDRELHRGPPLGLVAGAGAGARF